MEVLDHGFVRLVECWGHGDEGRVLDYVKSTPVVREDYEVGIIEAARQSTQGSFRGWDKDAKLLQYLYEHKHNTPFEFAGMVIEVRAPIMVYREWHRHRTQSYNEMSARYAPLPELWYRPTLDRVMMKAGKQGGSEKELTRDLAEFFIDDMDSQCKTFAIRYKRALENGVPRELARIGMPVGWYSQMRASACLRNWLAFLTLRLDPAAQWEIRQYAQAVGKLIETNFPQTWKLFCE